MMPANSYLSDAILQRDIDLVKFTLKACGADFSQKKATEIVREYGQQQKILIDKFMENEAFRTEEE